jgi:hypothetical protein
MGTYLQGVQSIIPSIQPHDTGLNMVANLLQLKQNQYDSNYKQLNKMYGQFYYADLTRDDNIKRRDATVQQIDLDLKRIAGLDLSLDQNVQQASQVFKPFYEDGALMKDMAWTKNFNNTLGTAEGLLKSDDEKARKQYWDDGIRELQYRREEFKNATPEEAMGFGDPVYTSYVNVAEKTRELAKKAGLSYEKTTMSADGKWILKNKNGQLIIEPLSNLFEAEIGRDPAVQAVYRTQAYVNRKDFAKGEADKYGGEAQAEMEYMKDAYGKMKKLTESRHADKQANSKMYDAQIADIQKQIKEQGSDPLLERQLQQYQEAKGVNDEILGKLDEQLNQFNSSYSSSGNTSTGQFQNPYKDVNQLRNVVDGNMANMLMNEDLMSAATTLAYTDAKEDFKENPYAVLDVKHAHQMSEINAAGSWRYQTEQLRGQNRMQAIQAKAYYDEFSYSGEPKAPKSSGSKSGSGKRLGYEDLASANAILSNPFASEEDKQKAQDTKIKFEEQQNLEEQGNFRTKDKGTGANLPGQNTLDISTKGGTTMFDKEGKPAVVALIQMYKKQLGSNPPQMTKQQFAEAMGLGSHVLSEDKLKHPAYQGKSENGLPSYTEMHALATDPDKLLAKINSKDGFEFIMTMTNMKKAPTILTNRGAKPDAFTEADAKKRGYALYTTDKAGKVSLYKDYSPQNPEYSRNSEFNYLSKVTANGMKYIQSNPKASAVQEAMTQGLNTKLTNSAIISDNMQDYKSYRDQTKTAVINHMLTKLENDPQMIRDFGTPIFKNGKYAGNDMSRLREELENMYTYSGNLNTNYKPKTNYQLEVERERYAINQNNYLQGLQGRGVPLLGPQDYNPVKYNTATGVLERKPAGKAVYKDITNSYTSGSLDEVVKSQNWYYSSANDPNQKIFSSDKEVSDFLSNKFATEYANSIRAIYKDQAMTKEGTPVDVTSNIPVPGYEKVDDGSGIGMLGLTSTVNLAANTDATQAFYEFTNNWDKMKNSLDGLNSVMSFEGTEITGFNSGKVDKNADLASSKTGLGKRIMDEFLKWTTNNATAANRFDMDAQRIAAQNQDLGAMTMMLPESFLKTILKDKDKNPDGYLEKTDYDNLAKYGLSVIAPNSQFDNLMHNSMVTPFQGHINYRGDYTYEHPTGLGTYRIRKGGDNEPQYVSELTYKNYDGSIIGSPITNNSTNLGRNLEADLNDGIDELNWWSSVGIKQATQQQKNIQMKTPGTTQPVQPAPQQDEKPFSLGQPD